MKLYPIEPSSKLAAKISGVSKWIKMNVLIKNVDTFNLDTLVVIGNGTPDDIVVSIVAFHLNGDKIAGIVKPKTERRYGFINVIPLYLKDKARKVLALMDQEDDPLNAISERIQTDWEELTKSALEVIESEGEERVRIFKGKYGSKEFELILVINGLDAIHTDKHCIEDHLVSAAQQISISVGDFEQSKAAWRSLSNDQQLRIYKELKAHRNLLERACPQQIRGCRYLE
ncbi:MAG: hypothetical protein EFT35_05465 [Methanophagales archaeon ANME-1-THS]|nr:MAG: hypothetical protein EFT35_05465 [Methanophagales archaeon ANME-1-THS]